MTGQTFPGLIVSFMREITLKRKIYEIRTMGKPVTGWQAIPAVCFNAAGKFRIVVVFLKKKNM